MNEHVHDWISAYSDGELRGVRLRRVEAHLGLCAQCRAELEALQSLSAQLQLSPPMPARTPPDQFVAQVRLRLPARPLAAPAHQSLRQVTGLWLPLGVLVAWAFGQSVLAVSGLALAALPPLPVAGPLPLLAALAPLSGWGGWLAMMVLSVWLTAVAAGMVWASLAGWWAAQKPQFASPPAGDPARH
jgi:anti-sigma factor RsiW